MPDDEARASASPGRAVTAANDGGRAPPRAEAPAEPGSPVPGSPVPSRPRRRPPRRGGVRTVVAGVVILVVSVLIAAVAWYRIEESGSPGPATVVTVADGSSAGSVTAALVHQHVVGNSLAFRVYLTLHGTPLVQPGSYLLHQGDSFADVRAALAHGPNVFAVDVLPGFTIDEVATRVGQIPGHDGARFLSLASSGTLRSPYQPAGSTNLDGLVGAGTYIVLPGESDRTLLGDMIDRFNATADAAGLSTGAAALGITPYQAITVASIVQKEGVYQKNLGKVSRVVYNRLARGTPLQMDSTVLYSEHRDGGPVTAADLALDTPYNTYLHTGLTPTPICFPSKASLQAALAPSPGDWLYFVVVSKDGTEAFSNTFAGQQANERLAQSRGLG